MPKNNLKKVREEMMISRAELSRMARISPTTLRRIEGGMPCRLETKRKILIALGKDLTERKAVFPE